MPQEPQVFDVQTILDVLPHRYPFLMIDKVIIEEPGKKAVGIKAVTFNEPQFCGHFPGLPVLPGVMIVEAMAQTGIMLVWASSPREVGKVYFRGIEQAKFRKVVSPGCLLELHVELISNRRGIYQYKGKAIIDKVIVAESMFSAVEVLD